MLAEAYYRLEDYASLARLAEALPEGDALLPSIGDKLASVGLAPEAVAAHVRGGSARRGVECCAALHRWDEALSLAAAHSIPQARARACGAARAVTLAPVAGVPHSLQGVYTAQHLLGRLTSEAARGRRRRSCCSATRRTCWSAAATWTPPSSTETCVRALCSTHTVWCVRRTPP